MDRIDRADNVQVSASGQAQVTIIFGRMRLAANRHTQTHTTHTTV